MLFSDLACSGCQEQEGFFTKLLEKYPGKIKIVWKGLPVTNFPIPSRTAHAYAFCANEQNRFNEFKTMAFTNKENLSPETLKILAEKTGLDTEKLTACLNSERPETYIKTTEDLAKLLNIQSVPTFFINNIQIKAPQTVEGWEALLQL